VSFADSIFLICLICIIPWLVCACLRIPQYTHQLAKENFDSISYIRWIIDRDNMAESRYFPVSIGIVALWPIVFCGGYFFLPSVLDALFNKPLLGAIIYLATIPVSLYFAPRSELTNRKIAPTMRMFRLLITALFLELILVLISIAMIYGAYLSVADPNNSPEAMGIFAPLVAAFILLAAITTGPIAFVTAPYVVPFANWLNRPLDFLLARNIRAD